jgi:RND family efflux transporter MFP subunit
MARVFNSRPYVRRAVGWSAWSLGVLLTGSVTITQSPATAAPGASEFECVIEPQQVVKLASPVVGVIARLDVDRGDIVRRGQIVGKMEDGVEAAQLALARARATNEHAVKSAEARARFLRRKHGRLDELHTKSVSSLASVEEADAEVQIAEQQLKEAQLNRELARLDVLHAEEVVSQRLLRSPIDGVVVERLLVPGEYRNDQSPVLTLAQVDPLRVEVFVPTAYFGQIRVGSQAEVRPEQPIGGIHVATVSVVDHVLDAASGTFGVRLALPNPQLVLPAGIHCKVTFVMHRPGVGPAFIAGDALSKE